MIELVQIRSELPWLGWGPLFRVHEEALPELREMFRAKGFLVLELNGSAVTSRDGAHEELARVFEFPSYYGKNWDAFTDSMEGFVEAHQGQRIAVLWRDIEASARQAPATTVEVGWALLGIDSDFGPGEEDDGEPWVDFTVFAIGRGDDFDRP